jgi:hypothetical protein
MMTTPATAAMMMSVSPDSPIQDGDAGPGHDHDEQPLHGPAHDGDAGHTQESKLHCPGWPSASPQVDIGQVGVRWRTSNVGTKTP